MNSIFEPLNKMHTSIELKNPKIKPNLKDPKG
jgi:hypothetical protein